MKKLEKGNEVETVVTKVAVDMHLRSYRVVRKVGHGHPFPAQKFSPERFYVWLAKLLKEGRPVAVCYEAGCFGYEPARRMQEMGAAAYVIAPQDWDEQQKRQVNDKLDAEVMCRRLSEYLDGDKRALSIVRIPSREEEEKRSPGRLRQQLRKEVRRMQAMGRSLLLQQEMAVRGRWWQGTTWALIHQRMPGWVIEALEVWKRLILETEKEAEKVENELRASAPKRLLVGEGQLSHALLERELMDYHRFKNSRQVGNYFGLCPSEESSGETRRLGPITKHGNPKLRVLLVEMAWRMLRFQPHYEAVRKWSPILDNPRAGSGTRKKALVALARQLAVDLWKIGTGRRKAEELGLVYTAS